ncbi:MAG TPA: hypothetical protein DCM28_03125 [Phycisphaerales bacterium]|nr:hypothetical protein [Phycisphaerales bacterium]|tara:strand:+ start:2280 stop:2543 length:264 start_codon:yes stop_codon:yes gene_type:complete
MGLEFVEILLSLENHFGISISDDQLSSIHTVGNISDEITKSLIAHGEIDTSFLRTNVLNETIQIIAKEMRLNANAIDQHSRLVGDII